MDPRSHARFPSDVQVRLHRQELEQQRRVEQLEQARQMNQISPDDYNKQLHLMSFSYLANIMAMRERKRQNVPAYHQHYHGQTPTLELKMETHQQQEWRRRAGRRSAADTGNTALSAGTNVYLHPSAGGVPGNTGHTVSSSSKIVRKSQDINGHAKPSAAPIPPSRWKELRQSVRIKATMDTEERRLANARIADLCEEDREKVAKLIRRIVEIGTLQEEAETEFTRQRGLYEAEIRELREQVKRDASELEDLSDKLKATLLKLRDYQERVLVLEESNDVESRHRLETDQTMDLLKMEVEKLRKLVQKQKEEMELKDQEEQSRFKQELERVQQQLRDAQEELLHERRDRIQEKQRELDERLMRSMVSNASAAAVSEKAHLQVLLSSASSTPDKQSDGAPTPSIPQLDMSSFLNTSVELPERIKDIMDEWKQRMEDAIAGTVRSIADQSRAVSTGSQGVEQPGDSHEEGGEEEEDDDDGDESASSGDDDERDDGDDKQPYQNEPNSRTSRAQQRNSQAVRRKTLQLGFIPKVNRTPFDKYLSIESEVGSEAESHGDPRSGEILSQEEEKAQMARTRQRGRGERRDKTERPYRTSGSSHHRQYRAQILKPSSRETRSQNDRHRRKSREDYSCDEKKDHVPHSQEANRCFEEDDNGDEEEEEGEHERGRQPGVDLMHSINSQPFVLINGGYQGGQRAGVNTSFSSLYETSLFDVVDAMEGEQASHQQGAPSQTTRSAQQHIETQYRHFDPEDSRSSSSTRLQSLLQGMQIRERKLARLDGHNRSLLGNRNDHQRTTSAGFSVDEVDDFEIFNVVKDIYEKDLFESRQQRGVWTSADGGRTATSTNLHLNHQFHSHTSPGFADSGGSSLGPPLSQQDLSVREAIEKEMAELLQEEAFQELLQ